jgi:mono/diheme cytochrome c family protein
MRVALRPWVSLAFAAFAMSRLAATLFALLAVLARSAGAEPPPVDFNREIRPILSNRCAKCHGPDASQRQGGTDGLRLDTREGALADLGGYAAIVPGHPEKSALIARVTAADENERMPPKEAGPPLTPREIERLRAWIAQGAPYAVHWSYQPPRRPPLPAVQRRDWLRSPIDAFILHRLEQEGLAPAPEAELPVLLRRVALDLTGLPPTPEELSRFTRLGPQLGYQAAVDYYLASPRYGEHWAHAWLDLARYADSAGYADDPPRVIWPYRDWVIRSLNANLSLVDFTVEQLAGDLLPSPTQDQLIATAFHRNTLTNNEGGTDDEEFRNAAVVDRVNTTFAVWMGTTIACAQCHSHKYDPISQEEYFRVFAIFNNTQDADRKDESPTLPLFSPAQHAQRQAWQTEIDQLRQRLSTVTDELLAGQPAWEAEFPEDELELLLTPPAILDILQTAPGQRTPEQAQQLRQHYLAVAPARRADRRRLAQLEKQLADMKPEATVPIMQELPPGKRRTTRLQYRGNFLDLGPTVQPGTPACFPPLPEGPVDRLALARWLMAPENPLTARVFANRFWEQIFGQGLVATSEEFGSQGEWPSHPELLDWLATELVDRGWDQKAFLRLLVTSATYRQSSRVTPAALARDPDNRLWSRGPRVRHSAEMIRDQALAISGLLSTKMFGPPVRPPQPSLGLNAAFGSTVDWQPSTGEDRYRRALYTMWRRSNPYPSMTTFDAPNREVCTIRRSRTNTPLQALVTLNDPVYVEAAQAMARRLLRESEGPPPARLAYAWLLALARPPSDDERSALLKLYEQALAEFRRDASAATQMAGTETDPPPAGGDTAELAAWTVVCNVILNLDELIFKR